MYEPGLLYYSDIKEQELRRIAERERLAHLAKTIYRMRRFNAASLRSRLVAKFSR